MSKRPFSWEDRFPDRVTCIRCLEVKDKTDFDRLLWCDDCRAQAKVRAGQVGWIGGVLMAAAVSGYIWGVLKPTDLITQLWLAIPIAIVWLGARFTKEIAYGVMRFRNARATDATPPAPNASTPDENPPSETG